MTTKQFTPTTEHTMGSQCTRCKGTGFLPKSIASGDIKASQLVRLPCDNPHCTVNRDKAKKLGRGEFTKLQSENRHIDCARALISVMPEQSNEWAYSRTVEITNVAAKDVLEQLWEATHQMIDDGYRNLKMHSVTIDGTEYSFKVGEQPECGRLTTERKAKEPIMSPEEKAEMEAIDFGPNPRLADHFGLPDTTINPDADNAPTYEQTTESVNKAAEAGNKQSDAIGKLNLTLWNMIAKEFGDKSLSVEDNKAQLKTHYMKALKASTFNDFVMKYMPIEKAAEVGESMIKAYIAASMPQEPVAPPSSDDEVSRPAPLAGNPFKPAERGKVYVKMGIAGVSGSGKTYTALKLATDMFPKGKVAMICTEHGAAKLYAPYFKFDLVDLTDYSPTKFIQHIKAAEEYGYDALVIDSLTAEWEGDGGILSIADGNFGGWKKATPLHQEVISTIQDANIHIFCTMLSKMGYDQNKDERGKTVITKTGMEPKQRKDIEGEFHLFAEMDDSNKLTIVKSRCKDIKAKTPFDKGDGLATLLAKWVA